MRRGAAGAYSIPGLALVAIFALAPVAAWAESGATLVAIVTADPSSPLTRRVRAELQTLGVDIIVIRPPEESSSVRTPLEQSARNVGAVAAIRLVPSAAGRVEVWVADRVTGKAVVRELEASGTGASDAAIAVGSVELLRASLMELHAVDPPRGEVPPTAKIEALALPVRSQPWTPLLGLAIETGADLGLRGLGTAPEVTLGLWLRLTRRFGVRLLGEASLSAAQSSTDAGSIAVRADVAGAMLAYSFEDASAEWVPSLSGGFAAAHVSATGTADAPFVGTTASRWYAAPVIDAGLAWAFVRGLRVRADAMALWTLPSAVVATPDGGVGHWGAPGLMLSAGLEVLWGGGGS